MGFNVYLGYLWHAEALPYWSGTSVSSLKATSLVRGPSTYWRRRGGVDVTRHTRTGISSKRLHTPPWRSSTACSTPTLLIKHSLSQFQIMVPHLLGNAVIRSPRQSMACSKAGKGTEGPWSSKVRSCAPQPSMIPRLAFKYT